MYRISYNAYHAPDHLSRALRIMLSFCCGLLVLFLFAAAPFETHAQAEPPELPPLPNPEFGDIGIPPESGNPDFGDIGLPPPGSGLPTAPNSPDGGTQNPPDGGTQNPPSGGTQNPGGSQLQNPLQFETLGEFLRAILDAVILIAFPILILFLVYAGFLFVRAQGNPEELARARRVFLWTLVGALLVLGAQALSLAIEGTVQELQGAIDSTHYS